MTFGIVLSELKLLRSLKILLLTSVCGISGQKEIICEVRNSSIVELRKNPYGSTSTKVPLSFFKAKIDKIQTLKIGAETFFLVYPPPPPLDGNVGSNKRSAGINGHLSISGCALILCMEPLYNPLLLYHRPQPLQFCLIIRWFS